MDNVLKRYSVPSILLLALLFFPAHSDQWCYSLILATSLLMMAFFGHAGMHLFSFDRKFLEQTFFFKCCLGQILLLLLWLFASPLVFILKVEFGLPLNLSVLVLAFVGGVAFFRGSGKSFVNSLKYRDPIPAIFLTFALLCIFKIAAYYSLTVGALGLDTHQHIYYTNDLYQAAYLKVAARGTNFLDGYAKGLHALVALWVAPGFGSYIGPAVRIMPALQTLLITFSFIEVVCLWIASRGWGAVSRWVWLACVLLVSCYATFFGSRLIYPIDDLNSTGRISSAAVMLLPGVVGFASSLMPSRQMVVLNWGLVPLCGALAVKINPSLAVAYMGFAFIFWLFSAFNGLRGNLRFALISGFIGAVLGSILVITDPYYLGLAIAESPSLRNALSIFGINSLGSVALPADNLGGFVPRFIHAIASNITATNGKELISAIYPASSMLLSPGGASALRSISLLSLGVWILLLCLKSLGGGRQLFAPRRALLTLVIGLFAGCLVNYFLVKIVVDTIGVSTHDTNLLATYALRYESLLSMFLMQVLCVSVITMAFDYASILRNNQAETWKTAPSGRMILLACAVSALCLVPIMRKTPGYLPTSKTLGWWKPIRGKDLREFHRVEVRLPDDGLVLAEAVPAKLNAVERWILPIGRGAGFLPFAERRYAFNVELGAGVKFDYDDIYNNFCTGNSAAAREFLIKNNVKYIFSPDSSSLGRQGFMKRTYCDISYRDLGVEYPAAFSGKDGIEFYRINIPGA